jgi:hypothetical protein
VSRVPIFVLTHDVPADQPPGRVRYVTDVRECAGQARAAAGDGDVMVHGTGAAQELLRAGQLDGLELHVVRSCSGGGDDCSTTCRPSTSSSTCSAG